MRARDGENEYLVIAIADSRFALRAEQVESAVAPRQVTPLPFVPAYVEGLVNINDRVMPLLDLRALVMPAGAAAAKSELVVVETTRAPCALRVDRVVGSVSAVENSATDDGVNDANADADAPSPAVDGGAGLTLVSGRFVHDGMTVLVLDCRVLGGLVSAEEIAPGRRGLLGRLAGDNTLATVHTEACIVALSAGETYGIALADAVEILDIAHCAAMPGAPAMVEGLALVRGEPLLVLSLAGMLGRGAGQRSRSVIVVERAGERYGLRVDRVDGIRAYPPDSFRGIDGDGGELAGIVVDGERAIGRIGIERLFNDARRRTLAPFMPSRRARADTVVEAVVTLLEVDVGGETVGVPVASVRRIAAYSASIDLDRDGSTRLQGAVNIDGSVLPVLDLGDALGLTADVAGRGPGKRAAWIVVGSEGHEWALAVNRARSIVSVPASAVEVIGSGEGRLVNAVARVDAHLISLLDITPLLEAA